jgi:hypothetical protein
VADKEVLSALRTSFITDDIVWPIDPLSFGGLEEFARVTLVKHEAPSLPTTRHNAFRRVLIGRRGEEKGSQLEAGLRKKTYTCIGEPEM